MTSKGFVSKRGGLWFLRSDYSALVKHVQKYGGDSVAPSSGWSFGAGRKALQTRTGSSMSYVSAAFLGCSTWQRGGGALSSQESHEELKKHSAAVEEADGNIAAGGAAEPKRRSLGKGLDPPATGHQ